MKSNIGFCGCCDYKAKLRIFFCFAKLFFVWSGCVVLLWWRLIVNFAVMNLGDIKIEVTDDGSSTLYVESLDEHYHSVKGALRESEHVYRDCAFKHRASGASGTTLRLLEVGFGTGLNAAITAVAAGAICGVHYFGLEKFPVDFSVVKELGYERIVDADVLRRIHEAEWNRAVEITPSFVLEKRECDFLVDELPRGIDVVYFDAFAPEKQPEMWTYDALRRVYDAMNLGGVLTTYCAKGEFRRMLQSIGFVVERIAGPRGGKREILRATK